MIYLDTNATAVMKPAVRAAIFEAMERHGNPSSVHRYGRIARRYIEDARAAIAALVGVKGAQVIFTSGGTESNTTLLRSFSSVVASTIEHDSVLSFGSEDFYLPVTKNGIIDLDKAYEVLKKAPSGSLISVMLVNNETGVIQPVTEISKLAKQFGHIIHTDAVQAVGRLPIDFADLGVDALTLSAHKISGPQGVGALIVKDTFGLNPLLRGGGQERSRRAGTENVAGIVGFGVAAQLAADDLRDMPRVAALRDALQSKIKALGDKDVTILGETAPRVANTLCVALHGISNETQVASMDLSGIAVSAGSACSSGKVKASHVLTAMGYTKDVASCALRISLGWHSNAQDVERCIDAWHSLYQRTRISQKSHAA